MGKRLMLFVVLMIFSMISCTKIVVRERLIVGDVAIQAVVDSLQHRIEECSDILRDCRDLHVDDIEKGN